MHSGLMRSSGAFECRYVGLGEILQHMQVFCIVCCKKTQGCSQLPFCVGLTFLQLSHHVIVFEEDVGAECVCEQHLEKWTLVKTCTHKHNWKN